MPRAALAPATMLLAAAATGLLLSVAIAGSVPAGGYDALRDSATADVQTRADVISPAGRRLGDGDAIPFGLRANATTLDERGFVGFDAIALEPDSVAIRPLGITVVAESDLAIATGSPVVVPLPGAVFTGLIGLATVAWAGRRHRSRRRKATDRIIR